MSGKFFEKKGLVQLDNGANRQTINTDKYCETWTKLDEPTNVEGLCQVSKRIFNILVTFQTLGNFIWTRRFVTLAFYLNLK